MSGRYGTIQNIETGERVEINHTDWSSLYWDKNPSSRLFKDCGNGRLYEYVIGRVLGRQRWEWVTEPEGGE